MNLLSSVWINISFAEFKQKLQKKKKKNANKTKNTEHITWPQLAPAHEANFENKLLSNLIHIRKYSWLSVFASKAVSFIHIWQNLLRVCMRACGSWAKSTRVKTFKIGGSLLGYIYDSAADNCTPCIQVYLVSYFFLVLSFSFLPEIFGHINFFLSLS